MQPVIKLALMCDYALTSQDGKLSAIGVFNAIPVPTLPGMYPRMFVVMVVGLDRGTHFLRLDIIDPLGQGILQEPPNFEVPIEIPGIDINLIFDLPHMTFSRQGIYQAQLFVNDRLVHSLPFTVEVQSQEQQELPRAN